MSTSPLTMLATGRILIVGLGREGLSTLQSLRTAEPELPIDLADDLPWNSLPVETQTALAKHPNCRFKTSHEWLVSLEQWDTVIRTAGVPVDHPLIRYCTDHGATLTSNTELFFELQATLPHPPVIIGVTGTKGKSTTTALIFHLLKTAGLPCLLGGNIGTPALELWPELSSHAGQMFVALELSAHQLQTLHQSPQLAVVLNIVPEHLDYYPDFASYLEAKSAITRYQKPGDAVIYNPTFAEARSLAELSPGQKLTYLTSESGPEAESTAICSIIDNHIYLKDTVLMPIADVPLLGAHNHENILPAVAVAAHLKIPLETLRTALTTFEALPHRLQRVAEQEGVLYINDSLSTVPEASLAAIRAFQTQPVILIAGGYDRHLDFTQFGQALLQQPIKALLLFKPTGSLIAQAIETAAQLTGQTAPPISFVESMAEAVETAKRLAQPGDVVLLSPASASFGRFKDYQDRGNQFAAAVNQPLPD